MSQKPEEKTRRGVLLHKSNPFVSSALVATKNRRITNKKGDMMIVNSGTGEVVAPVAGFWQTEEVDSTKFVKLYLNGVKAFRDLSSAGAKVFEVLYFEVQKAIGQDKIYLSFGLVDQAANPMAPSTYKRGLHELITKGFLAATALQGWYWLNPDYLWNGDRLAFVKEYYKTSREQVTLPHKEAPE